MLTVKAFAAALEISVAMYYKRKAAGMPTSSLEAARAWCDNNLEWHRTKAGRFDGNTGLPAGMAPLPADELLPNTCLQLLPVMDLSPLLHQVFTAMAPSMLAWWSAAHGIAPGQGLLLLHEAMADLHERLLAAAGAPWCAFAAAELENPKRRAALMRQVAAEESEVRAWLEKERAEGPAADA